MDANKKYGTLITPDAKLQRMYFNEMVELLGVNAFYQAPLKSKDYTLQGELDSRYMEGEYVGCIFEEYISQKTAKKLGWDAELQEQASIIHVPYNLHDLQIGALFTIPSAFDDTPGRKFRVTKMSAIMIYPASISCELVPEYESTVERAEIESFERSNFNVLNEGD